MKKKNLKVVNENTGEVHVMEITEPQQITFKTQYNAKNFPDEGEVNNDPSETIPGQTMSINEILTRFAKGLPITGAHIEEYDGGEDLLEGINWQTLDITEKAAFVDTMKAELSQLQKKYEENEKRKKQKVALDYQERQKKLNEEQKVLEKVPTKDNQGTNSDKG